MNHVVICHIKAIMYNFEVIAGIQVQLLMTKNTELISDILVQNMKAIIS
jgi:hypothetical protein